MSSVQFKPRIFVLTHVSQHSECSRKNQVELENQCRVLLSQRCPSLLAKATASKAVSTGASDVHSS